MRLLALVGVVLIHAGSVTFVSYNVAYANQLSYVGRYAIPVFFTVAALLQAQTALSRSRWEHVVNRFRRLVIPYIIWTGVYTAAGIAVSGGYEYGPRELLFYGGGYGYHLWFLMAVFIFDVLAVVLDRRPVRLALVGVLALNALLRYTGLWQNPLDRYFVSAFPWSDWLLLYFVVLLLDEMVDSRPGRVGLGVGLVLSAGIAFFASHLILGDALIPAVTTEWLVAAMCVGGVFISRGWVSPRGETLSWLAGMVIGIYVLHYGVTKVLVTLVHAPDSTALGALYIVAVVVATLVVSVVPVALWKRARLSFGKAAMSTGTRS